MTRRAAGILAGLRSDAIGRARPDGTVVSALSPAAVSMASIMATLSVQDVVGRAFAEMLLCSPAYRSEALSSWGPGICGATYAEAGPDGITSITTLSESFGGGGGARIFADGIDSGGVFHSMASRIANVESHESRGRLLELYRREARDSGGAGRFRGGAGLEYAFTPHKAAGAARLITRCSGVAVPGGRGLAGGFPGAPVSSIVLRSTDVRERFGAGRMPAGAADLAAAETVVLAAKALSAINEGDVVISGTPGGGGFGDPLRRDPEAVARDVLAGLVSEGAAGEVYGVVAPGGACDAPATELTRRELLAARVAGGSEAPRAPAPGGVSRPVGDTLEAVGALLRCGACGAALGGGDADQRSLGVARERPLALLGDRFAACDARYVLREYSCPGCGTLFGVDVQERGDEPLPGARLGGESVAGR